MGSCLFYVLLFLQPPVQLLECRFAQCFRQGPHNSLSLLLCAELSDEGLHCRESGSAHVSFVSKDLNVISWGPPFWSTLGFHTHSHPYSPESSHLLLSQAAPPTPVHTSGLLSLAFPLLEGSARSLSSPSFTFL